MFATGRFSTSCAVLTCVMEFPTSTRRRSPVAVVTTAASCTACACMAKLAVGVAPPDRLTVRVCSA